MTASWKRSGGARAASLWLRPGGDSIAAIAGDPRGALLAELDRPQGGRVAAACQKQRSGAGGFRIPGRAARAAKARAACAEGTETESAAWHCRARATCAAPAERIAPIAARSRASRRCRNGLFRGKPRRGSMPRSARISALSSAWCGSGRTISAFRRQDRRDGRRLRARGDPPACARPLRRHAAGGRKPSGHAALSRQCRRWGRTRSPASTATRGSTKISPARSSSCIRSACAPATPRPT